MIPISYHLNSFILIIIAAAFLSSCGSTKQANIQHGTGYNFQAGHPEFRISAFGFIDEQEGSSLSIGAEIVKGSLIYKKDGDSLSAEIAVDFQVIDQDSSENVINNKQVKRTVTSADKNVSSSRETVELDYSLNVDPSNYKVVVNVEDLNSNKNLSQSTETYIPATEKGAYTLSSIQMYGKQKGDKTWDAINTYDVKSKADSLRFVFQIISGESEQKMRLNSRLLKFASDTSYTRAMHFSNYSPSSIEYKGIDYDQETEMQTNQRILTDYRSVFIEYKYANQERGNYRFEVTAQKGDDEEIFKGRAFGVKSKNYPAVNTARELAKPLVYLMGEGDHEDLMEISNTDSLKKEMDRFWLKNIGNASEARDVIEMYYQRVEEANKQFSNFKEGWKTDLGMIYILFGPPWYTEDRLKELNWYYSYNREDPEYSYQFNQPKLNNQFYPFYHYLLERHNYYYTVQYLQRELWLTGQILTRQL